MPVRQADQGTDANTKSPSADSPFKICSNSFRQALHIPTIRHPRPLSDSPNLMVLSYHLKFAVSILLSKFIDTQNPFRFTPFAFGDIIQNYLLTWPIRSVPFRKCRFCSEKMLSKHFHICCVLSISPIDLFYILCYMEDSYENQ